MVREHAITSLAIEIIRVDHGERLVNHIRGHQNGMGRAPRLCPSLWNRNARNKLIDLLKHVVNRDVLFKPRTDRSLEGLLKILANHEDDLAESRAPRVEH